MLCPINYRERDKEAASLGARPIPSAPGYYVTRNGVVYSARRRKAKYPLRQLKPGWHKEGYALHGLVIDGVTYTKSLHKIVASVWLPKRPKWAKVVRHLDGNPKNNHVDNLAWSTQLENIHDKWRHGTMAAGDRNGLRVHPESVLKGEKSPVSKLTTAQVLEIRRRRAAGERGVDLAKEFKVRATTICAVYKGTNWGHLK